MRDLFSFRPSFYFHRRVNRFDKYLTNYCIINEQIESRTKQYLTRVSNSCINSKESCAINTIARRGGAQNSSFSVKINLQILR